MAINWTSVKEQTAAGVAGTLICGAIGALGIWTWGWAVKPIDPSVWTLGGVFSLVAGSCAWLAYRIATRRADPTKAAKSVDGHRHFEDRTIRLCDLAIEGRLTDATLERCVIRGPAVIVFGPGSGHQSCLWVPANGDASSCVIAVDQRVIDAMQTGTIFLRDVTLRDCRIIGVSVLCTAPWAASFGTQPRAAPDPFGARPPK